MKRLMTLATCVAITACGGGKGNDKGKDDNSKATAPQPVERDLKAAQKALASIHLPSPWEGPPSVEYGERSFMSYDVSLRIFLVDADDSAELADQPATSLDALLEQTKPDKFDVGWPRVDHRFAKITDKGAAGDAIWVRGPMQENDACGGTSCDRAAWKDSPSAGFVVYRAKGDMRYRCDGRAMSGDNNATLDEAFTLCKSGAWVP
jgi:hypothetical protein